MIAATCSRASGPSWSMLRWHHVHAFARHSSTTCSRHQPTSCYDTSPTWGVIPPLGKSYAHLWNLQGERGGCVCERRGYDPQRNLAWSKRLRPPAKVALFEVLASRSKSRGMRD